MHDQQNRGRGIHRLLGSIAILLTLGVAALSANQSASQTASWAAPAAAQTEPTAAAITGDYAGSVALSHVVTGVFSDTLTTADLSAAESAAAPDLGMIDLAFHLTQEGDKVTGYVLLDKTLVFAEMHQVTLAGDDDPSAVGPRVSGTRTGSTLALVSEKFTTTVSGQPITRQFRLVTDASAQDGVALSGEYRETIWGYGLGQSTVIGDFTIQRPEYGALPPPADGNSAPFAVDDYATTTPGTAVTINVLVNDIDPDGDALTLTIAQQPAHGRAVVNGGQIVYTPNAGFRGTDTFTYTVSDSRGAMASAAVTVTVGGQAAEPTIYLPLIPR